ncbi:spore germination protein [Sediminibacillus sp. JSM 1682029]|uniref:spore germination protein n=1 Tax=Sediminibacillus sp. JSM 1682029 TaxID=3229857 RepID=UPI0035232589
MWRKRKRMKAAEQRFVSRFTTEDLSISRKAHTNLDLLTSNYLENTDDYISFLLNEKVGIAYIETIVDDRKVSRILDTLRNNADQGVAGLSFDYKTETNLKNIVQELTSGRLAIFVDQSSEAFIIDIQKRKERALEEPTAEASIKGPRLGFNESLKTNISLIRSRIFHHQLKVEKRQLGNISKTETALLYLEGVANNQIVKEVRKRLSRIEVDAVHSSHQVQAFIKDHSYSIVPLIGSTERPDKIAANIMEGKVAILVDGTPFVLYGPINIFSLLQAPDDYYDSMYLATLLRIIRIAALFVSLLLPATYIALTTFHHEMIPTDLALSIAAGRETIPFPALIETLFIEITFEFLREAGLRLPKAIGNTISIVGALVIGDAAVRAGFVSPLVIIIVSVTAISSFIIPNYSLGASFRVLRFLFIFLAATFGFFGIVWGLLTLYLYLVSLRSFGYPYMAPHAPFIPAELRDTVFRFPLFKQNDLPAFIADRPALKKFPGKKNPGQKTEEEDRT